MAIVIITGGFDTSLQFSKLPVFAFTYECGTTELVLIPTFLKKVYRLSDLREIVKMLNLAGALEIKFVIRCALSAL